MKLPVKIGTPIKITSAYGVRVDPVTGAQGQRHDGYDIVSLGDKTVCAVVGGRVVQSRIITDKSNLTWQWGNYITILGDDGYYHYYCHLAQRNVEAGATVKAGDAIGIMGSTGYSTGIHLHYEVRLSDGWTPVCPEIILGIPNESGDKQYVINPPDSAPTSAKPAETALDNTPYEWAKDAVEWAVDRKILRGNEKGDLRLSSPVTREEVVTMLYRYAHE